MASSYSDSVAEDGSVTRCYSYEKDGKTSKKKYKLKGGRRGPKGPRPLTIARSEITSLIKGIRNPDKLSRIKELVIAISQE